MNNRELFIQAHAMTKQIRKAGDDYRATFGACLRHIRNNRRKPMNAAVGIWLRAVKYVRASAIDEILYHAFRYAGFNEWVGDKEIRQYINFGNEYAYAVVETTREEGLKIVAWSGCYKKKKLNAQLISKAKAAIEAAKSDLLNMIQS